MLMADLHHLDRREGRRRAGDLLERFDLTEAANQTLATYSGGMCHRLDLAMGLIGKPRNAVRSCSWPVVSRRSRCRRRW